MSCPVNTVLSQAAGNGYFALDDREILLSIVGSLLPGAGNPTATQTLATAATNGLFDLSDRDIDLATAGFLCGP